MKYLRILVYIVRNKYIVTTIVFFTWLIIFDKNNIVSQIELAHKYHQLQDYKKYYMRQINQDRKATQALLTNPDSLEKFAREKYIMKRDSEDVFLIIK